MNKIIQNSWGSPDFHSQTVEGFVQGKWLINGHFIQLWKTPLEHLSSTQPLLYKIYSFKNFKMVRYHPLLPAGNTRPRGCPSLMALLQSGCIWTTESSVGCVWDTGLHAATSRWLLVPEKVPQTQRNIKEKTDREAEMREGVGQRKRDGRTETE